MTNCSTIGPHFTAFIKRDVSHSRGYRTDPRTDPTVCGSGAILSQCECFPWLTFSWARFRDFCTRLARKPAPAWRFGPILFSAIVTFLLSVAPHQTQSCARPLPPQTAFFPLTTSVQGDGGGATTQVSRYAHNRQLGGSSHRRPRRGGGLFKLVLNLCRNGGDVQTCRASQVWRRMKGNLTTLTWKGCARIAFYGDAFTYRIQPCDINTERNKE